MGIEWLGTTKLVAAVDTRTARAEGKREARAAEFADVNKNGGEKGL